MKHGKIFAVLAVLALSITAMAVILPSSSEGAFVGAGTQNNPYTKLEGNASDFHSRHANNSTIWLDVGCVVNLKNNDVGDTGYSVSMSELRTIPPFTTNFNGLVADNNGLRGKVQNPAEFSFLVMEYFYDADEEGDSVKLLVNVSGEIPYTAPTNLTPITGTNWQFTPTSLDGVIVSVAGADWLKSSGNSVYGIPTQAGTYNVTVTMSKTGFTTSTNTFTLVVSSELVVTNSPTNGVMIFEV